MTENKPSKEHLPGKPEKTCPALHPHFAHFLEMFRILSGS
jgi:hypothetical protein